MWAQGSELATPSASTVFWLTSRFSPARTPPHAAESPFECEFRCGSIFQVWRSDLYQVIRVRRVYVWVPALIVHDRLEGSSESGRLVSIAEFQHTR